MSPFFAALLIGLALTTGFLVVARQLGFHKDRGTWVSTLIAIALFYIVFAVQSGGAASIALHVSVAAAFIGVALFGYVRSLWWVVIGLALHGAFDLVSVGSGANPAPSWWGPLCLGVDLLLAASLAFWLHAKVIEDVRD